MRFHRLLGILGLGLTTAVCHAFTLIPMSTTLDPKGMGTAQNFRLDNSSSNRVAFQISVLTRDMDENGNETNQSAAALFTVFPPQGAIAPGKSQNVRLVWKGPANPDRELAFRLVAEELPVNFTPEAGKAQIKVLLRYMAAVYVAPRNVKSSLQVGGCVRTETNTYVLTVTNSGTAHRVLREPKLSLTDPQGQRREVPSEALQPVASENVLAGRTRRFVLTLPGGFTEASYQAQLMADE